MTKADMEDIYDLYSILYQKFHKNKGLFLSKQRWSELFSLLTKGRKEFWRVVGITPNAINHYQQNKYKRNMGLVRGHKYMRIKTFDKFFDTESQLNQKEFWSLFKKYDEVIIMTREENKNHKAPKYINIHNPKSKFFTNSGIGWQLSSDDVELLKSLGE